MISAFVYFVSAGVLDCFKMGFLPRPVCPHVPMTHQKWGEGLVPTRAHGVGAYGYMSSEVTFWLVSLKKVKISHKYTPIMLKYCELQGGFAPWPPNQGLCPWIPPGQSLPVRIFQQYGSIFVN